MNNINQFRHRIRTIGQKTEGEYVLYWMQISRRFFFNHALDYAIEQANNQKKPLVVLEGLSSDYPWATARMSTFILEGMTEHADLLKNNENVTYIPYPEQESGNLEELLIRLCNKASMLITDEYPVFIMRQRNERLQNVLQIPFHTIDSNGLIPMALSEKAPYSAFIFRKLMQRKVVECLDHPPEASPLDLLKAYGNPKFTEDIVKKTKFGYHVLATKQNSEDYVAGLRRIEQKIKPVALSGTREAALKRLEGFVTEDLSSYDVERNHPDYARTSRLSPWLHIGKLSSFEIVQKVLDIQPDGWDIKQLRPVDGKRNGFWGGHDYVSSFLDEVITWRETGFHFAYHRSDYDRYDALPDWALETLNQHRSDPRAYIYSLDELELGQTHDVVWNAAQKQLREDGIIHNYLRMLWGKKILEWTPDPETALSVMIDLNNRYALDGRDPNSYSGIFWILGRFDRAWGPERPVFGKIRYMSSDNTQKKVNMSGFLKRYGDE